MLPLMLAQAQPATDNTASLVLDGTINLIVTAGSLWSTALGPQMLAIAYGILPYCLYCAIALMGLRIMFGMGDPIQEIISLTLRVVICAVLLTSQPFHVIIANAMVGLDNAGAALASKIVTVENDYKYKHWDPKGPWEGLKKMADGTSPSNNAPINVPPYLTINKRDFYRNSVPLVSMWRAWLYDGTCADGDMLLVKQEIIARHGGSDGNVLVYPAKYTQTYVRARFFGGITPLKEAKPKSAKAEFDYYQALGKKGPDDKSTDTEERIDEAKVAMFGVAKDNLEGKSMDALHKAIGESSGSGKVNGIFGFAVATWDQFFSLSNLLTTIAMAFTIQTMILAGFLTPQLASVAGLGAPYLALAIISSLSLPIIPLILFRSFADSWIQFFHFLISIALIPFFFHLMSAVGFVISTSMFEALFPVDGRGGLTQLLSSTVTELWSAGLSMTMRVDAANAVLAGPLNKAIAGLMSMSLIMGRNIMGVSVITTFVIAGVSLTSSSVSLAASWSKWFADGQFLQAIQTALVQTTSGIGNAVGQGVSQGMSRVGQGFQMGLNTLSMFSGNPMK